MLRRLYSLNTWFLFILFIVVAGCVFSPHEEYINPGERVSAEWDGLRATIGIGFSLVRRPSRN